MTTQTKETVNTLYQWAAPVLVALVGFFAQLQLSDIRSELKELKLYASETRASNAVLMRDIQYLQKKIDEHERWLDDIDKEIHQKR